MNARVKGFAYGATAAASYGLNPLFALPLYAAGMNTDSVLFYRYFFALVMMGVMMKLKGESFALRKADVLPLAVMGLLFSSSSLFLFESYNYMDAGIASTLLFVYPVLVAIIMAVFFYEKVSVVTGLSIGLALWGISMLYQGGDGTTLNLTGVLFVFLSSLTYAIYIVGVNRSSLRELSTAKLTFYALLFGILIYVVRLDFCTELQAIPEPIYYINAVSLALFPTIVSLITMTQAIHYIGSTPTAILGALEPVTALFIGVIVFGEQFTPRIALGVFMILVAVTLIVAARPLLQTARRYVQVVYRHRRFR